MLNLIELYRCSLLLSDYKNVTWSVCERKMTCYKHSTNFSVLTNVTNLYVTNIN